MGDVTRILGRYGHDNPLILTAIIGIIAIVLLIGWSRWTPRRLLATVLAWSFPGLGHLYLGQRRRGIFLGGLVIATFVVGLVLADFRNISPFERHPIWGLAHFFGGLMALVPAVMTLGLHIESDVATYGTGCLYSAVATLLNIVLILDVWDRAEAPAGESTPAAQSANAPDPGAST